MRRSLTLNPALGLALLALPLSAQTATPAAPTTSAAPAAQSPVPPPPPISAAKRAKVEQLLDLNGTDVGSKQLLAGFPERVKSLAARQPAVQAATTPEQKKLTADYLDQMGRIAADGSKWEIAQPKLVELYAAAFSESDIDAMIAFYQSPAGKAMISKTPELSGKTLEVLQSPITALGPQFEAATKAYQTSMQNTLAAPAAAPASKAPTLGPQTPASKPSATPKK